MKKNNLTGEYELLIHSIDGNVSIYRLDRRKFRLFTLGRKGSPAKHLSVQLPSDDSSEKGHWLSSMQCYFAWDIKQNDWVVGNGKPLGIYIPSSARKYFSKISQGPSNSANKTHVFLNNSRPELDDKTSLFKALDATTTCANILALAFVRAECEPKYQGDVVPSVEGWTQQVKGQVSFAYLIEVVPMKQRREHASL